MGGDIERMQVVLARMADLLRLGENAGWAEALDARRLELGRDPAGAAAAVRGWWDGAGSLGDVVLYRRGRLLHPENREFEVLRDELARRCDHVLADDLGPPPRRIEGHVQRLRCQACHRAFPNFVFSGDTDMATAGLMCLASRNHDELVLAETTAAERDTWALGGDRLFERRLAERFGRPDLGVVRLRRTEGGGGAAGVSFQVFRQTYAPPTLVFACIRCDGDSRAVETLAVADFERAGGRLYTARGLRR